MSRLLKAVFAVSLLMNISSTAAANLPTVEARLEMVAAEHRLDGVVEAVNQATVSAQTSGRIIELPFDVDDFVEKGEVIVRFRDNEQRARFDRAQASLSEAEARLAEAETHFKRVQEIHAQGLVSKAALDRAEADFNAAKARLAAAKAAVEEAREQLEQTVVRAPYSGIVVERHVQLGELANLGTPLMTGLSLEHLRVVTDLPQSLIGAVRMQPRATVYLPDGTHIDSESLRIFPYAQAGTHTFRVRVNLPEGRHGVYPGMLLKVGFEGERNARLVVPAAAIARRGELSAVYVLGPLNELQFRQVRIGNERNSFVEILAGLESGEWVVTDPVAAAIAIKDHATDKAQ